MLTSTEHHWADQKKLLQTRFGCKKIWLEKTVSQQNNGGKEYK